MSTHNICFRGEIRKILCGYPLLSVAMIIDLDQDENLCSQIRVYPIGYVNSVMS